MLVVSVSVDSLVLVDVPTWFNHAKWAGVGVVDLVFPTFVTLTGCGLGFAMHRRTDVRSLGRRILVLVAVGLLYNALVLNSWVPDTWRFTGVLQLYAVVVLVLALLHLVTRDWRGWALLTVLLAAASTVVLTLSARDCPGRTLTPECNPSGVVDLAWLGPGHMYAGGVLGHDPEGLVAILGALVSASAGVTLGHLLLARPGRSALPGLALALGAAGLAWACSVVPQALAGVDLPTMKRLWTPPFGLSVAAGVLVVLLMAHLLLDRPRNPAVVRGAVWPLIALGRNSLLVYFGSHVAMALLTRSVDAQGVDLPTRIADGITRASSLTGHEQLAFSVAAVLAWTLVAAVLHRFRIYLRP